MLINSDGVLSAAQGYRLVWLNGRFGSGKTSLAYRLAQEYLERGYRLITNNACIWDDGFDDVRLLPGSNHLRAVIILDEGGLHFKASRQIEMIAAFANKMDCIYLIPSFFPPTRSAQVLTIQPVFNFKAAGIPLIVYKWRVKIGSFSDGGTFYWFNPAEIYGVYSRQDPGDTGAKIISFLLERTEEYKKAYGRGYDNGLQEVEVSETDIFTDAVSALSEAADNWASIPVRKPSRRRF